MVVGGVKIAVLGRVTPLDGPELSEEGDEDGQCRSSDAAVVAWPDAGTFPSPPCSVPAPQRSTQPGQPPVPQLSAVASLRRGQGDSSCT